MKESEQTIRRIISRLYFIRKDLEAIDELEIKSEEVKKIISEMREKAEFLYKMFLPFAKDLWLKFCNLMNTF